MSFSNLPALLDLNSSSVIVVVLFLTGKFSTNNFSQTQITKRAWTKFEAKLQFEIYFSGINLGSSEFMKIYKIRYCAFYDFSTAGKWSYFYVTERWTFFAHFRSDKKYGKNRIQNPILRFLKYGDFTTPTFLQMTSNVIISNTEREKNRINWF